MVVGILQFELLVHDARSLKDKRRVVRSVKDRLHREHQAAVAEVARADALNVAVLALAVIGSEGRRVAQVLDAITAKLHGCTEAELGATSRQLIHGRAGELPGGGDEDRDGDADAALAAELLARAAETTDRPEETGP